MANLALLGLLLLPQITAAEERVAADFPDPDGGMPVAEAPVLPEDPPAAAEPKQREFSVQVIRGLPTEEKVVALTFDDGPRGTAGKILAILRDKGVPGTFFLLGANAGKNPALVAEITGAGCEIANHTWSHPSLTKLGRDEIAAEVERCTAVLAAQAAEVRPYLRPPYGRWDEDVLAVCAELGYHLVLWDVDSRDWEYDCPKTVLKKALTGLKPGSIVLFHDGPRVSLEVLPRFIDAVRARGYRFVLISDYIR